MPKRGKKNAAELERESDQKFVALRQQHSAVESEINSLEHHGLNRCLDVGLPGYLRYVGYGVMSYNLHVIRAGVAGAGMGAGQAGAVGGLKPPDLKPQAKTDRGGVATAGEF
jgi:hypothetical protein